MSTSPSPTPPSSPSPQPQFFQRKTSQVQAIQWPDRAEDGQWPGETVAAIFNWVADAGGRLVWRVLAEGSVDPTTGAPEMYPALVNDDGEVAIVDGEWIVRLPGYTDPATGKPSQTSRWIVEAAPDFAEDYQSQQRQRMAAQTDFLQQAEKLAKGAELQEESMTPFERREASAVELHRLGDVVNKGGQQ